MRRRRRFFTLLVLTIVILVGLFCFSNLSLNAKTDLQIDKLEGICEAKENESYASYNKNLIISNGSLVKVINKNGKEQLQTKFYTNNLNIQTNDSFALLADVDGGDILLLNKNKISCQITTEKILFARLQKSGDFIVGHSSGVEVYNKKGERYLKVATDYYILDATIWKKSLVVSGFKTSKKTATGIRAYYDITTGEEHYLNRWEHSNDIFPELKALGNRLISINENKIIIQKGIFDEEIEIKFANKTLKHYYITSLGKIICLFNEGANKTAWETYSLTGELRESKSVDINIKSFIYSNNGFSLLGDNNIQIYNTFGWLRKMTKIDKNIVAIAKSGIYIIENGEIKYIKL